MALILPFTKKVTEILQAVNRVPDLHTLTFTNCRKSSDAIELLNSSVLQRKFEKPSSVCALLFEVDDDSTAVNIWNVTGSNFGKDREMVVGFLSERSERLKIFWKLKDTAFVWTRFENERGFYIRDIARVFGFIVGLLRMSVARGLSATNLGPTNSQRLYGLNQIIDADNLNLLMSATKSRDSVVVSFLLNVIDVNGTVPVGANDTDSAIRVAYRNDDFEMFLKLLKANSMFPDDYEERRAVFEAQNSDLRDFLEEIAELHKYVDDIEEDDDFEKLVRHAKDGNCYHLLTDKLRAFHRLAVHLSRLHYCFSLQNVSLAGHAAKLGKKKLLDFIIGSLRMTFGPNEQEARRLCTELTFDNIDQCKKLPYHHIDKIFSNLRINDNDAPTPDQSKALRRVFDHLNAIVDTRPILRVIAAHGKFKLVFNRQRNDVTELLVGAGKGTLGACFLNGNMVVGAKDLLSDDTVALICADKFKFDENLRVGIAKIIGTLKHELCHYAVLLVFGNACNPFSLGCDSEFDKILEKTKTIAAGFGGLTDEGRIVRSVFSYPKTDWAAELVVRPAQIYAEFSHKPAELARLRGVFPELFRFFEQELWAKFEGSLSAIEKLSDEAKSVAYDDLTDDLKSTLRNKSVSWQGDKRRIAELIDTNGDAMRSIESKQIRALLSGKEMKEIESPVKIGEKIAEPAEFVERTFRQASSKQPFSFEEIKNHAQAKRLVIVHAGVEDGKTTLFDVAAWRVKKSNPGKWILRVDERSCGQPAKAGDIGEFLLKNVLGIDESSFAARVFLEMLQRGDVVLFWDHFELADIRDAVLGIKERTNCEQWLAVWDYDDIDSALGLDNAMEFTELTESEMKRLVGIGEKKEKDSGAE